MRSWLAELPHSPRTVANYRGALQTFFNFGLRRGWLGISPMAKVAVEDLPRVRASKKHALSIEAANDLLRVGGSGAD